MINQQVQVNHLSLNLNSLSINGAKVKLERFPYETKPNYNVKQISLSPLLQVRREQHKSTNYLNKRQAYKVNVNNYTNSDIHNKQLKEIYEAIEFDDFKRFLCKNRTVKKNVPSARLSGVDVKHFYEEHFQVHYDFLKGIVKKNSTMS